jgi:sugar lactone lactonase YvrE
MHNAKISAPQLVLDARAELAEGPAWEPLTGCLYWVDIHAGHLHIFHPKDGTDQKIDVGEYIGCAAPRRSGGLVLGLRSGFATLDLSTEELTRLVNPEPNLPGNRFNDGKCDPVGRFLAGTMNDTQVKACGSLYSLAPDGTLKTLVTGTLTSNGLAWSPDQHTFYFIDTPTLIIMAYDYDPTTGEIANPRPLSPSRLG